MPLIMIDDMAHYLGASRCVSTLNHPIKFLMPVASGLFVFVAGLWLPLSREGHGDLKYFGCFHFLGTDRISLV